MRAATARNAVTVVIVTFNSADIIDSCLEALGPAFPDVDLDVVVVDSGSTDGTAEHVRTRHRAVRVEELGSNRGYAAAINAGARLVPAHADLLVLNPDARLRPGAGVQLLVALEAPGVGIAVPVLVDERGELQHSLRRRPSLPRALATALLGHASERLGARFSENVVDGPAYGSTTRPDWATGAVMMISSSCRAAVGPWDESYFLYSEETDYCLRAGACGLDVVLAPSATATHVGGDSAESPRLWSILVRNRASHYRRTHGMLPSIMHWAVLALGEAARAAAGSTRSRASLRELLRAQPGDHALRAARESQPGWICFSAQDWWYHNHGHSDFQLMRRLARNETVLFVNSIGMRMPTPGKSTHFSRRIVRKAKSTARGLRRPLPDTPRFYVLTCLTLPFYGNAGLRRVNTALVRAQVRLVCQLLGVRNPTAMVTIPTAWPIVESMAIGRLIFNRSDKHSAFGEVDRPFIEGLERSLLEHSSSVLYVSRELMREDVGLVGDRAVFLDHGVDLEHFVRREERPADMHSIQGPIIGFFGGIDDYVVDLDLVTRVAREFPDCSLVLVGAATCELPELEQLPNVHLLGYRPYEEIPSYGSAFDVALMPWLQNEWIRASNPIKVKEYLALGLPVVTTRYGEVGEYEDVMYVADTPDEFVACVARVLRGDLPAKPDECRKAVRDVSWDSRVDVIRTRLEAQS